MPLDADQTGETVGMLRSDLSFCQRDKPNLFATAVSARVEIYRVSTRSGEEEEEADPLKPIQKITKFKETVTAVQMR